VQPMRLGKCHNLCLSESRIRRCLYDISREVLLVGNYLLFKSSVQGPCLGHPGIDLINAKPIQTSNCCELCVTKPRINTKLYSTISGISFCESL